MILKIRKRTLAVISILFASGVISVWVGIQISTNAQIGQDRGQSPDGPPNQSRRRVIEIDEIEWRQDIPLPAKVGQSTVIAIGVPLRNVCRPSQDGNHVTTDYEVQLQEVIKGEVRPGSIISVSMPGGLVTEADQTLLEVRARPVRKMQNGRTYVLFLKAAPSNGNAEFTTVRGSQGLYEIPPNGSRLIHLGRSFELPPADDGEEVSVFVQAVRRLSRNR